MCLKYSTGGHFGRHADRLLTDTERKAQSVPDDYEHVGTLLAFPPLTKNDAVEGGNLHVYMPDGSNHVFTPYDAPQTHWRIVALGLDVHHMVSPVTKGERYVLKTPLFVKKDEVGDEPIPAYGYRPNVHLDKGVIMAD